MRRIASAAAAKKWPRPSQAGASSAADQAQVRLVDQGRGLEGLARASRGPAVARRASAARRRPAAAARRPPGVAPLDGREEPRHVVAGHRRRRGSPDPIAPREAAVAPGPVAVDPGSRAASPAYPATPRSQIGRVRSSVNSMGPAASAPGLRPGRRGGRFGARTPPAGAASPGASACRPRPGPSAAAPAAASCPARSSSAYCSGVGLLGRAHPLPGRRRRCCGLGRCGSACSMRRAVPGGQAGERQLDLGGRAGHVVVVVVPGQDADLASRRGSPGRRRRAAPRTPSFRIASSADLAVALDRPAACRPSGRTCGRRSAPAGRCRWSPARGTRRSRAGPRTRTPRSARPRG